MTTGKTIAAIAFCLWMIVGTIVIIRLEMRLQGWTWREFCTHANDPRSVSHFLIFRRTNRIMISIFAWPIVWYKLHDA